MKLNIIILAAGYGTRLYPLTKNKPKALLDVAGKPLIDYLIEQLEQLENLEKIYVVSNAKFYNQFVKWKKQKHTHLDIVILNDKTTSNETKLGAVGDINFALQTAGINKNTLITASDNIYEMDMLKFVEYFKQKGHSITGYEFQPDKEKLRAGSVLELDSTAKVISFEEKPREPKGEFGGLPIFLLKKEVLRHVSEALNPSQEYMGKLLQHLVSQGEDLSGFPIEKRYHFTTKEDYYRLNQELSKKGGLTSNKL